MVQAAISHGLSMGGPTDAVADARASLDRILELQARIRGMQETTLDARALPTLPALEPLLPGGALKAGASYAVHRSMLLALALLAGPSAAGSWCAVVGMPTFGAEAAARHHFGKSARDLSAHEAALLAAALPNPIRRSAGRPSAIQRRLAARLLSRMNAAGAPMGCLGRGPSVAGRD